MLKAWMAAVAAAFAVLLLVGSVETAQAHKGRHHWSGGGAYSGRYVGAYAYRYGYHHHHHHRRVFVPVYGYGYGAYGYDDCYWLHRRAVVTGSGYWWSRYRACISGYY